MSDLISRQAAIRAVNTALFPKINTAKDAEKALRGLPSAQPEIIRCKDCKYRHLENMIWTCPFGLPGGENFFCGYGAEPYKGEQDE